MPGVLRSTLWLGFFGAILGAWWIMYAMAVDMDVDLLGRPGAVTTSGFSNSVTVHIPSAP